MRLRFIATLFFLLLLFGNARLQAAEEGIAYEVVFKGVDDKKILADLKEVSSLVAQQNVPPLSYSTLQRRAESDLPQFEQVLRSYGYYSAHVSVRVERDPPPAKVVILVYMGPAYTLERFTLQPDSSSKAQKESSILSTFSPKKLGLRLHRAAQASKILGASTLLVQKLTNRGYPLAKVNDQKVVVDQTAKAVYVTLLVDTGPLCYFGDVQIAGPIDVKEQFIIDCLTWVKGERYDPDKIDESVNRLKNSGLFNSVTISHAATAGENGELPILISLTGRKHHTIGTGISWGTYELWGVGFDWEHRNLFGVGQKVGTQVDISQKVQVLDLYYRIPHWLHNDQDLLWLGEVMRQDAPGFHDRQVSLAGYVERTINDYWWASYGGELAYYSTTKSDNNGEQLLVSVPLGLQWSTANDLLNPTKGQTVYLTLTPYKGIGRNDLKFSAQQATWSIYFPLNRSHYWVFAFWTTLGIMVGESSRKIPPPVRFYAGTQDNLRGYKFKSVGPLGPDKRALGGRSIALYAYELRFRSEAPLGGVLFYEFGNVFSESIPQLTKKLLQSWGVGLRYYSMLGPLSLDVAFPINRRKGIDSPLQVYVNIGQAF